MPPDAAFHHLPARDQLVRVMRRLYDAELTTLSGGNLSIREADGTLWVTPAGVDKGRLVGEDIVRLAPDGSPDPAARHRPSSELPFHQAIYAARPDLRAVVHAHPPTLVAFSLARRVPDLGLLPGAAAVCGPVGYAPYALTGTPALGAVIAGAFADGHNTVLLENHGVVTAGESLLAAFQRLETLDFSARAEMYAGTLGGVTVGPLDAAPVPNPLPTFAPPESAGLTQARRDLADVTRRAYARRLFSSTQGTASMRGPGMAGAACFVIAPQGADRALIADDAPVLVADGQRADGSPPDDAHPLHAALYAALPDVHSVITALPPQVMAYALAGQTLPTHTIPESYMMLADLPLLTEAESLVVGRMAAGAPVVLTRAGLIVTGRTLLESFDRLEVAEYSARALLQMGGIGPLVPLSAEQVVALGPLVRR